MSLSIMTPAGEIEVPSRELSETHENIVNLHIQIKYYADAEAGSMLKQAVMNIST